MSTDEKSRLQEAPSIGSAHSEGLKHWPSSPLGPSHLFLLNLSHLLPPPLRDA